MPITTEKRPVLAIDIGNAMTRSILFDVIGEHYSLIGIGKAVTTLGAYGRDIRHGVRLALEDLQAVTGYVLLNPMKELIRPLSRTGDGVDKCVITFSAGRPLKIYLTRPSKGILLDPVQRLVKTTYSGEVLESSLDNGRSADTILDEILLFRPDLIVVLAGGGDQRTLRSALRQIEPLRLAISLLPEEFRPEVLFIGTKAVLSAIQKLMPGSLHLYLVEDPHSTLDHEILGKARTALMHATASIRARQLPGLSDVMHWSKGNIFPTVEGINRVVSFLSQSVYSGKGVLGIDMGATATTMTVAFAGRLASNIYPTIEMIDPLAQAANPQVWRSLHRWLTSPEITDELIQEYLLYKTIYPASYPLSLQDMVIQNALARCVLETAWRQLTAEFSADLSLKGDGGQARIEPILASGSLLVEAASPGQACLIILDGLQPIGITNLVLDKQRIAAALGVMSEIDPKLAAEVIDSNHFQHLATIITLCGRAPLGTPILRVKMIQDDGYETVTDIRQGELEAIPLPEGKAADVHLQPFHRFDVGMGGAGRGGKLRVTGSVLGIVIDGRGRPLVLPEDDEQRRLAFRKWLWMLGG